MGRQPSTQGRLRGLDRSRHNFIAPTSPKSATLCPGQVATNKALRADLALLAGARTKAPSLKDGGRAPNVQADAAEVHRFLEHAQETIRQLDQDVIGRMLDCFMEVWRNRGTVFVMGNGGSASTATHFAADLAKYTISQGKPRFRAIALTDNAPLVSAWTNDSGFNSIFVEQMAPWLQRGDVLVGFSVHGGSGAGDAGPWSQNMIRAMQAAKDAGATVIGFSGYDGGAMGQMADYCITVPVFVDELGTPLVESAHVLLHHLIVHRLRERIKHA